MEATVGTMTLEEIVTQMRQFTLAGTVFTGPEFVDANKGELAAYDEILPDLKGMKKDEFVEKYLTKLRTLHIIFETNTLRDEREIERLSGYNNGIVRVLRLIHPKYEYELTV